MIRLAQSRLFPWLTFFVIFSCLPNPARSGAEYRRLRGEIRESEWVHTDDTGWRMGGKQAFLLGFETSGAAVDQMGVATLERRLWSWRVAGFAPAGCETASSCRSRR